MLKKILGEAPFDAELSNKVLIHPGKKTSVKLLFSNISEYDMPLSCKLSFSTSVEVDKSAFDIIVPADGKTECELAFAVDGDSKIFTGSAVAELEIFDRIFDSRTLYEFEILCEAAYKCADKGEGFAPCHDGVFTNDGIFFANKSETVFLEIPLVQEKELVLNVISGSIKSIKNGAVLRLSPGLNRLSFEMLEDGSFEFCDTSNDETMYPDTLNTKHFI